MPAPTMPGSGPDRRFVARRFVLASASPARLRLLRAAGLDPEVRVSGVDEAAVRAADPDRLVAALARAKADAVAAALAADPATGPDPVLVLGCDSMLDLDGEAFGKPASAAQARELWRRLAGRTGVLRTGHALLDLRAGQLRAEAVATAATAVRFTRPTEPELAGYLASGEPLRVAGGFTVDGLGSWFVDGLDGDAGTVIGLSLPVLRRLLAEVGVAVPDLWSVERPGQGRGDA